ncbi:hypothetical protein BO99DRAFT_78382 [Aspergillus violaceofuscus CBS 115571]|uniref:Uncharacterized protein n=1 Tax=Aspergillus violaceofuscus (strain CBS 115571) TaxID=1450538 RepID=A0A2V5GV17_ASPV1|nr:hypothetical protein BO99DRAFT_78382 [Aspergillus violaceofuscus CBS 115571]
MVLRILSNNPWETTSRSGLVHISTHSLFISTSGPPRWPGSPVVLFFTGGGAPSALENPRLSAKRLLREQQFARQVLGNAPLSVICADFTKDFRLIYEAGVQMGNGTSEEREQCTRFFEQGQLFNDELRAGELRLSGYNRFKKVLDEGHSLPVTRPEILVDEVQWVVDMLHERGLALSRE